MRLDFTTLIIVSMGAFFFWTLSGYKGTFNNYMSRYYEADSKYEKNYWTGLALLAVLSITVFGFVSD
jgi:hypothetical protein